MPRKAAPKATVNVTAIVRPTTLDPDELSDPRLKTADRPWWIRQEKTPDAKAEKDDLF